MPIMNTQELINIILKKQKRIEELEEKSKSEDKAENS